MLSSIAPASEKCTAHKGISHQDDTFLPNHVHIDQIELCTSTNTHMFDDRRALMYLKKTCEITEILGESKAFGKHPLIIVPIIPF